MASSLEVHEVLRSMGIPYNGGLYLFPRSRYNLGKQVARFLDRDIDSVLAAIDCLANERVIECRFGRTGVYYKL